MKENILKIKTYSFATKMVRLCYKLQSVKREYVLSKQLLRSATSVGANVEESIGGRSAKDLYQKLTIAYKEARESHYWLRLLGEAELIKEDEKNEYLADIEEILRILGASLKTLKQKLFEKKEIN